MRSRIAVSLLACAMLLGACASRRAPAPSPTPPAPAREAPPATAYRPPAAAEPAPTYGQTSLQGQFAAAVGDDRVYFDLDSSVLRADALPALARQAAWLAAHPEVRVLVAGNCDERGTREYNIALGARRAQAVAERLLALGLSPQRLRTISYGKERPLDPGVGDAAWARNRNAQTLVGG